MGRLYSYNILSLVACSTVHTVHHTIHQHTVPTLFLLYLYPFLGGG